MMQRRGYFISRYNAVVFRTWSQAEYKQALRAGHQPIVRKEYLDRLAWANQVEQMAA